MSQAWVCGTVAEMLLGKSLSRIAMSGFQSWLASDSSSLLRHMLRGNRFLPKYLGPFSHMRNSVEFLISGFNLTEPWLLWSFGEGTSEWRIYLSQSTSLCYSAFQIIHNKVKTSVLNLLSKQTNDHQYYCRQCPEEIMLDKHILLDRRSWVVLSWSQISHNQ